MFEMMLCPKGSDRCFTRPSMGCSRVTSAWTAKPMNATYNKSTARSVALISLSSLDVQQTVSNGQHATPRQGPSAY